ncbi:MAG: transcriptional regulator [Pseudomonadota bacterium]|nr:transcriptional regulator [Pseudomonadota bacterium]
MAVSKLTRLGGTNISKVSLLVGINNAKEHKQALEIMEESLEDYHNNLVVIEALSNVIARYEEQSLRFEAFNKRLAELDPAVATLKVMMDQYGLNTTDFEDEIGKKSMVSLVLSEERNLAREHITKLAIRFDVSPSIFF